MNSKLLFATLAFSLTLAADKAIKDPIAMAYTYYYDTDISGYDPAGAYDYLNDYLTSNYDSDYSYGSSDDDYDDYSYSSDYNY